MNKPGLCCSIILLCAGLADLASAQPASESEGRTVAATGIATITRRPEIMRLQITLQGRGATLKEALTVLKDRETKAKPQLIALGADKESIKVEDSRITDQKNDRNHQMQAMMLQRMRRGAKGAKPAAAATPPVIVSAVLTAEWKLTAKSSEELLLAVHPIQEKIKAADLSGSKQAEKLTPEEEELLEEAQNQYSGGDSEEAKAGEPIFVFLSRISTAEQEKALAEAFEKSRQQAANVARAAGAELGELTTLRGSFGNLNDLEDVAYNSAAYRTYRILQHREMLSEEGNEAFGVEPLAVKKQATVHATFILKPKK